MISGVDFRTFISYESLKDLAAEKRLEYMSAEVLEEYAESAGEA